MTGCGVISFSACSSTFTTLPRVVDFLFFLAPYPTTTTSLSVCLFSFMAMSIVRLVSTRISTGSYPIYSAVNRFLSSFLTNENSPFIFVMVPIFVPLYVTLAPISGSPFSSVTLPLIMLFWGRIVATLAIFIFLSDSDSKVSIVATTSCNAAVSSETSSIIGTAATGAPCGCEVVWILAIISFLSACLAVISEIGVESVFTFVVANAISFCGVAGTVGVAGIAGVGGAAGSANFVETLSSAMNTSSVMLFFRNRK